MYPSLPPAPVGAAAAAANGIVATASPSPIQVTASSGIPATMPIAFQVPAATRIQQAATRPDERAPRSLSERDQEPGRERRRRRARTRRRPCRRAAPRQKFCTPHGLLLRRVGLRGLVREPPLRARRGRAGSRLFERSKPTPEQRVVLPHLPARSRAASSAATRSGRRCRWRPARCETPRNER